MQPRVDGVLVLAQLMRIERHACKLHRRQPLGRTQLATKHLMREAIKGHQAQSSAIKGHQAQPSATKRNQGLSAARS
jgi:hypothetical protein